MLPPFWTSKLDIVSSIGLGRKSGHRNGVAEAVSTLSVPLHCITVPLSLEGLQG